MNLTTLFGLSSTMQAIMLVLLAAGTLLIIIGLGIGNPLLWRMGMRNMRGRRSQTFIMLFGLLLSTIFITAAFGLQDSMSHSLENDRLTKVGNVDESVTGPFTQAQVDNALRQIRQQPEVQAVTAISLNPIAAQVHALRSHAAANNFYVLGLPPDFEQVYGAMTDEQGHTISLSDLQSGNVLLSHSAAAAFDVHTGDHIQIIMNGQDAMINATVQSILSTDPVVTDGELGFDGAYSEVLLPLATLQEAVHHPLPPNTICIKNRGQGGMDDIGPAGSRSQAVTAFLGQLFHVLPDTHGSAPTYFDSIILHTLKPNEIEDHNWNPIAGKTEFTSSPAARQFDTLLPIFTILLVSAGMLLLVLLCLLLASDRRAELGLSRALGLQRSHIVQTLLIECASYGLLAAVLGIPLGLGATALELLAISHLPAMSLLSGTSVPLSAWISWQSILSAISITILTTVFFTVIMAIWISHTNIVTAIRNLDDLPRRIQLNMLLHDLTSRHLDVRGFPIETPVRAIARRIGIVIRLLWELFVRGPLCILFGGLILLLGTMLNTGWLEHSGMVLCITGGGLLIAWIGPMLKLSGELSWWLGSSLLGLGWLIYGLQIGSSVMTFSFGSNLSGNFLTLTFQDILLSFLLPLVGMVVLVMNNADGLAVLLNLMLQRVRGFVPVSRTSLVYPLTFRFRTGVAVALLSLIVFLIMLIMTNNLGIGQQVQQVSNATGKGLGSAQDIIAQNIYTTGITRFLIAYLVAGLLFGAISLGVIASRAVVERHQQIGMLRAIGFSSALVRRSFLLEAGFIVALSLVIGTALAWWIVFQMALATSQNFLVPVLPTVLLVLGSYLVVLVCTFIPANRASHLPPAEALRYE